MSQLWIVSIRWGDGRFAVVGPARASTVEAVLYLAAVPEHVRVEIRGDADVRDFVEGRLDAKKTGYYVQCPTRSDEEYAQGKESWLVCIGPVHEVLNR